MTIHHATSPEQIRLVYNVMRELRPHLTADQFVEQVLRQMREHGYILIYIEESGQPLAAAGYRRTELLHWGKVLYIDDLVTAAAARGRGCADHLFKFIVNQAREEGLAAVHLDSGTHAGRYDAHRFYHKHGMSITSYHFVLNLQTT
ncbi:MAG: GNAT family N-acetyltransferase [bacterium]|nr:GNAT family N-acetyltransferase [bacterium]MBK8127657.1 GNAT family N-acetyltransferase [bacterium]